MNHLNRRAANALELFAEENLGPEENRIVKKILKYNDFLLSAAFDPIIGAGEKIINQADYKEFINFFEHYPNEDYKDFLRIVDDLYDEK